MGPIIAWMLAALAVAVVVVVLVLAGSAGRGWGVREAVGDFRRGLSRVTRRHGDEPPTALATEEAELIALAEPVDTDIDDFFFRAQTSQAAYVGVEELQDALVRARDAAARRIPNLNR